MRVELFDGCGYCYQVDSMDYDLIGRWFAEHAPLVMSADVRVSPGLRIWPTTPEESKLIPAFHRERKLTRDGILALAEHLTNISAEWPAEVPA